MKVALLSGGASIHTIRWANGLALAGHQVHLITQHPLLEPVDASVVLHEFPYRGTLGYFLMASSVKKLLKKIKPDVLNAHYASGYGTTARLIDFHPYLLSVWGSDVYDVPNQSKFHRYWIKTNLQSADRIASTSHCMATQTHTLADNLGDIAITPFGVDVERFEYRQSVAVNKDALVIGTIKRLAPKYGIDTLIESFALLLSHYRKKSPEIAEKLELHIVGEGPQRDDLELLAKRLDVDQQTRFFGRVLHSEVPKKLAEFDIYAALSRLDSESFGVAIIEAGAAGKPVVVSDAGGLPEVVVAEKTGIVVPRAQPQQAAKALQRLIEDPSLRSSMGQEGYKHVKSQYSWSLSVLTMQKLLEDVVQDGARVNELA